MSNYFKSLFVDTFRSAETEAETHRRSGAGKNADYKTFIICVTVAFCLTMNKYLGDSYFLSSTLSSFGFSKLRDTLFLSANAQLYALAWWVLVLSFFYFVFPVIIIKLFFREKLSDYGLGLRRAFKDYRLYLFMLVVMMPLVLFFSRTESFQSRYPFYDLNPNENFYPNLYIWEILYFLQFCALEFFFRGFMLHGTKHRFGFYSVFVMMIPYCMIHFGKPLPETIAAILAGIILGVLSLKSRSIWLGIAIHYTVAITMDLAALWQKGLL